MVQACVKMNLYPILHLLIAIFHPLNSVRRALVVLHSIATISLADHMLSLGCHPFLRNRSDEWFY